MNTADARYIFRTMESLRGLLAGIACDYELSDEEIGRLRKWLDNHKQILDIEPFAELDELLNEILEDHIIDQDERDQLLAWCHEYIEGDAAPMKVHDAAVARLHGFLQGISIDGEITDAEIHDLHDWLQEYESVRDCWPFPDIWKKTATIIEDGVVTEAERADLVDFCQSFAEVAGGETPQDKNDPVWESSYAPVLSSFESICEEATVSFEGTCFCFTGHARAGKRKELAEMAERLGASVQKNVTQKLDYLVIGALSSPNWAQAIYGRKVEAVMANRQKGIHAHIIHEDRFLDALAGDGK